jgi:hypothetical protein
MPLVIVKLAAGAFTEKQKHRALVMWRERDIALPSDHLRGTGPGRWGAG